MTWCGWRTKYVGNLVAITVSMRTPFANRHLVGAVTAARQFDDKAANQQFGAAVDERHLRFADEDRLRHARYGLGMEGVIVHRPG